MTLRWTERHTAVATRLRAGLWLVPTLCLLFLLALPRPAHAVKPIVLQPDADRLEITTMGELYESRGDTLQIEAAAGEVGTTGRMSVRAATPGTNPNWIVFALSNPTDRPLERWLTAERYTIVGSGVIWPDLDARRIEAVTPSLGFVPERIASDRADIFRITLEPGQTITYVAELSSERFARIYLWKPLDYEVKVRDRLLFNGIMLGLTGLLAIFLTAIFAANHKLIFPAAALVSWSVLVYLSVDFGFFHKLFQLRPDDNAVYRAAAESAMAASFVIFLHTFLRLGLSHGLVRMLTSVWVIAQLSLVAVSVIDPRLASTFARISFLLIGGVGGLFTLFLALRGQDRALSLIPIWLLLLVWIFGTGVTLTGQLSGDIVVSGLVAGLVMIVILIGFAVTQYAFRSNEPLYGAAPSELQLRSLAVDGAGSAIWEWNARRDEIKISPEVEASLGLNQGELSVKVEEFARHLHTADRERFKLMLWSIQERAGGKIRMDFRLRHADNTYRWFELEAASIPSNDRRAIRCVGLVRDVTDGKRAYERLMHDAVHCNLTGLPNRELLLDRLAVAVGRAKAETNVRPTIIFIDIDKFRSVNQSLGLVVGDSLLLTIARRLQRHLGAGDTLARVGGDQFAILMITEQDPRELASLAERVRRSLRSPIKISGQEIILTGSLGIAVYDGEEETSHDLLKEAEIAMFRAKRSGADRIEIFRPEMRGERDDRITIESDLRRALEKKELRVLYQPIIYLPTEELAGFEALVRWDHPKNGLMNPAAFVPIAEESDLIVKLGSFVLMKAAQDCARWQKELPREGAPLFISVNVSSRQLFRQDLIQEIRHILGRGLVQRGSLKLEVTESLVMENPEQATEILELLRGAGAELALDDFGTGYSSLAYLQKFPFDTVKIDKSLIRASSGGDARGGAIVRSMVALSHELGKKVVAEGVEEQEDASFLRSIGCEYAQGFYYGEPMPEREVIALLKLVKKSERKLEPRGLFRMTTKGKKKDKAKPTPADAPAAPLAASEAAASTPLYGTAAPIAASSADAGIGAAPPPSNMPPAIPGINGSAQRPAPAALPQATVRPRARPPAMPATATAVPDTTGAPQQRTVQMPPMPSVNGVRPNGNGQYPPAAIPTAAVSPPPIGAVSFPSAMPPPLPSEQPSERYPFAGAPMSPPAVPQTQPVTQPVTQPITQPVTSPTRPTGMPSRRERQPVALDLTGLPPGLAASLAKIAGTTAPPTAAPTTSPPQQPAPARMPARKTS